MFLLPSFSLRGTTSNLCLKELARELVTKWVRKKSANTIYSDDFGAGVEARGRRVRRAHAVAARREASPLDDGLARRGGALGDERLRGVEEVVEGNGVVLVEVEHVRDGPVGLPRHVDRVREDGRRRLCGNQPVCSVHRTILH